MIGLGFLDHFADLTSDDLPTSIWDICGPTRAFTVAPLPTEGMETLCASMVVAAQPARAPWWSGSLVGPVRRRQGG
jgi:hypothetical protein